MDERYAQTVRLLLRVAPDVFANDIFAMKGGTAINLFVRDMPRLSVDIDVAYRLCTTPREQALKDIAEELDAICKRVAKLGLRARKITSAHAGDIKLLIESEDYSVQVEVNPVFRGTVLPVERRKVTARTADLFSVELEVPALAPDELYAGKLVAALDRQHPRDLFDVMQLYKSGGLTARIVECFVTYLAGHNRPIHEVLFGNEKDITDEYHNTFAGMTAEPVALEALVATRSRLRRDLPRKLTRKQRAFLVGLARAQPDWALLKCPHASELPALKWKLQNLLTFSRRRPKDFENQARELERGLQAP